MTIKNFCEQYNKLATQLQDKFIKDNIKIKQYVPFLEKLSRAENLARNTMIDHETGNIKVNSASNYLFFCRSVIELYTDLQVETPGFFDEYDMLKSCGVLDKLMVGTKEVAPLIPADELAEFSTLCDMAKSDIMTNKASTRAFIESQVDRFAMLTGTVIQPLMENVKDAIINLDDAKVKRWIKPIVTALNKQNKDK